MLSRDSKRHQCQNVMLVALNKLLVMATQAQLTCEADTFGFLPKLASQASLLL